MGFTAVVQILLLFSLAAQGNRVYFGITHWNDFSGQLESYVRGTSNSSAAPLACTKDHESGCIGGLVNTIQTIYDNESFYGMSDTNIFRLSAGNFIGGESGWLASIPQGWEHYASIFRNHFRPHAYTLGMKEFGAGVQTTSAFLEAANSSLLTLVNTCDTNYTGDEAMFCQQNPKKVVTLNVQTGNGVYPVGVIGVITPVVERLSLPGELKFSPIVPSIKAQINSTKLQTYIVIGDCSLETAKDILDNVPEVKLVIYGAAFSNTRNMTDDFPMPYKHGYIATTGRYGSTVGKLLIDLDTTSGDFTVWTSGQLKSTIYKELNTEAKAVQETFLQMQKIVNATQDVKIGYTSVTLSGGERCRKNECTLGNLVTDAMVHCAYQQIDKPINFSVHSIWHSGAFYEDFVYAQRAIKAFDIYKWLPYHNRAHLVSISGSDLKKIFEASATGINPVKYGAKEWRQFLQVSHGIQVSYDATEVPKLVNIQIIGENNKYGIPTLEDVADDKDYYLVIPTYLYEGRGVFDFATKFWKPVSILSGATPTQAETSFAIDNFCVKDYIKAIKHVTVGIENRITISTVETLDDKPKEGNENNVPDVEMGVIQGHTVAYVVTMTLCVVLIVEFVIYIVYFHIVPSITHSLARPKRTLYEKYPPNQS